MIRKDVAWAGAVLLVVLSSVITFFVLDFAFPAVHLQAEDGHARLLNLWSVLQDKFYDETKLEAETLWDGAAQGLVRALDDPYSAYMTMKQYDELLVHTSGSYSGVGISFGVRNRFYTVIAPMRGTPAAEAGIRPGDRILQVDGGDIQALPIDEVASLIRGPEGSEVSLTLQRPPATTTFVVTLTRASIQVPATERSMLEAGMGYLQIVTFNEHTTREVAEALNWLLDEGAESLVLDLRENSGGYVHEGVNVASFFVPEGAVVRLSGRGRDETYASRSPALGLPLVVLVDAGTASTSEILAGAIQDWGVGTLVGTQTYGKGLVQELIRLDDGSGLRVTTALYLTPLGRRIHETGITPDLVVESSAVPTFLPLEYDGELLAGSAHWLIREVQERLSYLGYRVETHGVLAGATLAALEEIQQAAGLPVRGQLDAATLWAIDEALANHEVADEPLERARAILREELGWN